MIYKKETKMNSYEETNVLGGVLKPCCHAPKTGFYRNGFCQSGRDDVGEHTICIIASKEFLEFSKAMGNDLSTPMPQYGFYGVKEGQAWCLCATRWVEAYRAGFAPKVVLEATHVKMLRHVSLDILKEYGVEKHETSKGLLYLLTSM